MERGLSRRDWLKLSALSLGTATLQIPSSAEALRKGRVYEACFSPEILLSDPDYLRLLSGAGVSRVWLAGFFYGYWPFPIELLRRASETLRRAGLEVGIVNVPLGHPGDSLGSRDGSFPLSPPTHWQLGYTRDSKTYSGTSLHLPATEENAAALRLLKSAKFSRFFLDDDFRLARGPGEIGGCFCDVHRKRFLERGGFPESRWAELLGDIRLRKYTGLVQSWVEFTCDDLTSSFRVQSKAADGRLGIMVMYLGSEKAGIRLGDYQHVPVRVGELMFDDRSFSPVKGKTDELFSVLFHRRFAAPELAWSETTAFPSDKLSGQNMAGKLVISTIADVRHTTFMSGITPFPKSHWAVLEPEMNRQAAFHARLAGHRPQGPFKHYWGSASRYVGEDRPFSLFLATGVPFEVTEMPARDGWTFLSDADASLVAATKLKPRGSQFICRPTDEAIGGLMEECPETLEALFDLKRRLLPALRKVPYVEDEQPVVLAWYPSAHAALLWNVGTEATDFRLRFGAQTRKIKLRPLESALLTDLHA